MTTLIEQIKLKADSIPTNTKENRRAKGAYVDCLMMAKEANKNFIKSAASGSLLERAMLTLDDYLNAGCKKTRKQAAENAKFIYKEYYGVDYVNRNDR